MGLYRVLGLYWDNGERKWKLLLWGYTGFRVLGLGLYWDNGKENGSYYYGVIQGLGFRVILG